MKSTVSQAGVLEMVLRQLSFLYPLSPGEDAGLDAAFEETWERASHCYSFCSNKYFVRDGESVFDPFHGVQYTIFLYYFSNSLYRHKHPAATKVYLLNRALHGLDLYHEVQLPAIWRTDHPVGSVMGRATYSDYFSFGQGCTVGNIGGSYPTMGKVVTLSPGGYILGNCQIGDCCLIAPRALLKNEIIPPFSLVFGQSPNIVVKPRDPSYFIKHYQGIWKDPEILIGSLAK